MCCVVPQLIEEVVVIVLDTLGILQVLADGVSQDISLN